jgi:hypothetical protein
VVFLVGLLLAPVGAAIGALIFMVMLTIIDGKGNWSDIPNTLGVMTFFGTLAMSAALPVMVLIMPAVYFWYRRRGEATPLVLGVMGAIAGAIVSVAIVFVTFGFYAPRFDYAFWRFHGIIAGDGAFCGAICGAALGAIMRWWHPAGTVG